jgi:YidC/Oxa1 family membrane protein insertase
MLELFQTVFYQPIFNLLIFLYNTVSLQDFGVAIVLLTVIVKLILWPLSRKSIKSQKALQELQPKINELKAKHKGNQQVMGKELMALYKKYKVNPFSSCLPLLVQFPVFIAIYRIFREDLNKHLDLVYSFLYRPEIINTSFLGLMDLSKPNIYLAVMAGAAQFWQAKMMMAKKDKNAVVPSNKKEGMAEIMNKQMLYFMPAITIFIGVTLPGGLTLYWLVLTLLTVLQQSLTVKKQEKTPIIEGEVIE